MLFMFTKKTSKIISVGKKMGARLEYSCIVATQQTLQHKELPTLQDNSTVFSQF
jgi:hypothetical protein